MTQREAQEIVRMIESNWQFDLGIARGVWRDGLTEWDVAVAMRAIAYLAKNFHYKPKFADLTDAMRMIRSKDAKEALDAHNARAIDPPRGTYATPEWVWVWIWIRNYRDPREERPMPQMGDYADPRLVMTVAEYEVLRDQWLAAGSPKEKPGNFIGRSVSPPEEPSSVVDIISAT